MPSLRRPIQGRPVVGVTARFYCSWHGPARGSPKPPASTQTTSSWKGRTRKCCCAAKAAEPIPQDLARALTALLTEHGIANHEPGPIFIGARNERLTRFGATHIVRRAVAQAVTIRPTLVQKPISPHIFRHSLAMKLLQSGVDLLTIQAWLGHAQVATTHRYNRRGCRNDAQRTREGWSLRRSRRAFPTK